MRPRSPGARTSLLAATIGDRTWETVQRQCGLDVLRATTAAGLPAHLASTTSGCGAATVRRSTPRLRRPADRPHPQAFGFGGESVHTLHRIAPGDGPVRHPWASPTPISHGCPSATPRGRWPAPPPRSATRCSQSPAAGSGGTRRATSEERRSP
ncbi:hypothetical protein J7E95_32230 [Streptomyces sp. ISL-14]|nr:hypothetical protein [Streptomyces sp. ISL-14]